MVTDSLAHMFRVHPDGVRGFRTHVPCFLDGDGISRTEVASSPRWCARLPHPCALFPRW